MGDLMADPINMTHLNHLRGATRDMQQAARDMKVQNDRMAVLLDRIEAVLEKRGPGRPPRAEVA
jgi:hypothetical protein